MNLDWVTGAVVVSALALAVLGLVVLGVLDVARLYRTGEYPKPPTASRFLMRWAYSRPIVPFLFGLAVGIMAAHLWWNQTRPCP